VEEIGAEADEEGVVMVWCLVVEGRKEESERWR
jgi:hypothetical protein